MTSGAGLLDNYTELLAINDNNNNNSAIYGNDSSGERLIPDEVYLHFLDSSRFWIQRILVPLIMIIGTIGNTITIVIMTRRRMRSSTNWYLAALAIFDMLYLIFTFYLSFRHYDNIKDLKFYYYWLLWPYAVMICDGSSNTSIWLTVTFTIERYIAVCYPMKGKVICTESRARKQIFCVFIVCFGFTIPTPFEWEILERFEAITNQTVLQVIPSALGSNEIYKLVYYWLTVVLFIFIPFLLLTIFNTFLIRSVHLSRRQRRTMTRPNEQAMKATLTSSSSTTTAPPADTSSKQESRITIMLIAVVILFLICQLPTAVTLIYTAFHDIDLNTNSGVLIRGLGNIFNFLMAINAAGNFVLYCLLSNKYRRTFLQSFCPCLKGKVQRLQSAYQQTNVYTNSTSLAKKSMKSQSSLDRTRTLVSKRLVSYREAINQQSFDNVVIENTKLNGTVTNVNRSIDKW
ncbi:FMRFamide receptor-like [Oppia nitens]|uniref:FMRFamide receptor-like n=1 Tax=Oppia nitens TaxID=1686743 RepID=UPI0023DA0CAD|nr:FMRFamide receptor-like [Oppia nitens]